MSLFRHRYLLSLLILAAALIWALPQAQAQNVRERDGARRVPAVEVVPDDAAAAQPAVAPQRPGQGVLQGKKRSTQAQREAAAARVRAGREAKAAKATGSSAGGGGGALPPIPTPTQGGVPDVFGIYSNWANSPRNIRKFVDALPWLTPAGASPTLGQYIPVAKPDTVTYPGSDYYEISLVQYSEKMHSDLPPTTLRGYVQTNNGTNTTVCGTNLHCGGQHAGAGPGALSGTGDRGNQGPAGAHQVHQQPPHGRRRQALPAGGYHRNGVGAGTQLWLDRRRSPPTCFARAHPIKPTPPGCYTENRATLHLHGGRTPWISDGTPHQWITPAAENTVYKSGVSKYDVPDMPAPGAGSQTFYLSNQQSARLMFYHDHAVRHHASQRLRRRGRWLPDHGRCREGDAGQRGIPPFADTIPLVIQDKTFVDARQHPRHGSYLELGNGRAGRATPGRPRPATSGGPTSTCRPRTPTTCPG